MILTAPRDLSFPNGPEFKAGDPVDVAALAAALGRTDVAELGQDLLEQGWSKPKARKAVAAKKAAPKTSPAPAGDDTPDEGGKEKP